jgi:hypothetical protein
MALVVDTKIRDVYRQLSVTVLMLPHNTMIELQIQSKPVVTTSVYATPRL